MSFDFIKTCFKPLHQLLKKKYHQNLSGNCSMRLQCKTNTYICIDIYIYIPTNYCIGERLNFVVCRDLVFCKRCSRGSAEPNIAAWNQHVNMKQFGYPCPVSMFSYKICASMRSMFLVSGMMCVCMCCFLFVIMRFFLEWWFRFPSRCERILWCFCWRKLFFCEISVSKATGLSFPVFGVFGARIWVKFASSWFF